MLPWRIAQISKTELALLINFLSAENCCQALKGCPVRPDCGHLVPSGSHHHGRWRVLVVRRRRWRWSGRRRRRSIRKSGIWFQRCSRGEKICQVQKRIRDCPWKTSRSKMRRGSMILWLQYKSFNTKKGCQILSEIKWRHLWWIHCLLKFQKGDVGN